jgi:hypothetical protein
MVGSRDLHTTPGQVVTIAAATGGHLAAVERFAVTGRAVVLPSRTAAGAPVALQVAMR